MNKNIQKENINAINNKDLSNRYMNNFHFDINYQLLSRIIKDIQLVSQLIKCIQINQLSDIIFIQGNNSYSIESRFYLNYRKIIDFYVKVIDFIETENLTQIKYYVYKTIPKSNNFIITLNLNNVNNDCSKLTIEIILFSNINLCQKIVDIIFNELNLNFMYLSQSIKCKKYKFLYFSSNIIKNDFYSLSQIIKNIKLINYIINGKLEKISTDNNDNNDKTSIHVNEFYKVKLKKNLISEYINIYNVMLKVNIIRIKEDNIIIQYKIYSDNNDNKTNVNNITNNLITINIRKLTSNSFFILIKYIWDVSLKEDIILSIKNFINKIIIRIEKICNISNQ